MWVPDAGSEALRGVARISAVTIAAELGNISRFASARQLMGYSGTVPSENSSGSPHMLQEMLTVAAP